MTDEAGVETGVRQVAERFGRLDVVVNAAGVIQRQPPRDLSVPPRTD